MLLRQGKSIAVVLTVLVALILFSQPIVIAWKSNQLRALKWSMKTKMIQASAADDLISFSFSHAAWMNLYKPDPTEFVMDGVFYDIATVQHSQDGVMVFCLKDEKEGQLKAKLKRWMQSDHSPYHKAQKSLRDFLKILKFFQPPFRFTSFCSFEIEHLSVEESGRLQHGFQRALSSPPWLG